MCATCHPQGQKTRFRDAFVCMIPARGPQTKVILTIFVCSFAFAIAVASAIVIATAVVFLLLFLLLSRLINLSLLIGREQVLASGLPTLKQSKNSQAQALFGEYRCVLLTCIMESHAHAFFKAADAQKVGNLSLCSHAL